MVDLDNIISTVAGSGDASFSGDGGPAIDAGISGSSGVATDRNGNLYIADATNHRVRRVNSAGIITTILGNGQAGSTGDGGPATSARTLRPGGLAVYENQSGTERYLYVCEPAGNKVRRVNLNTNVVEAFAGTGTYGWNGDGSPATSKHLAVPLHVATDTVGNVYIADTANSRIRKVSGETITTIAGNGTRGYSGDGGLAISARLAGPNAVTVDEIGNIYIADTDNYRIRVVTLDGNIQTAAGTGTRTGIWDGEGGNPLDDLGNGGPATSASFTLPTALGVDPNGNLFIVDAGANTVRWIEDISSLYNSGPPPGALFGSVQHAVTLQAIPNVDVDLIGPTSMTVSTSPSGAYSATGLQATTWRVEPSMSQGFGSEAIDELDAMFVLEHLVNSRNLSPAQRLACDVTGNGALSPLDATKILQRAAGIPTPFDAATSCSSDWLFIPNPTPSQNLTEIQPLLSAGTCRMGALQYSPLVGTPDGQDFRAVVIGDCTGNWNDNGGSSATLSGLSVRRGGGSDTLVVGPARTRRGRMRVPITINGKAGFKALDIRLTFDPNALRLRRVHKRGAANRSMMVWNETSPGEVKIVLASAKVVETPARYAIVVDMETIGDTERTALRSIRARVDGSTAKVRMRRTRGRRR